MLDTPARHKPDFGRATPSGFRWGPERPRHYRRAQNH